MTETSIEEIIDTYERFRVLCVGRSGVGKSSLINRVFGITEAHVSPFKPGIADIDKEHFSPENKFFVLHDSAGFEPGNNAHFNTVKNFISDRSNKVELKDRLHAIWLCTQTPTAGGRLFEEGDKKLLKLAHEKKFPIVIVFTQYDKLLRTKVKELEKNPTTKIFAQERGKEAAEKQFQDYVGILKADIAKLGIPVPNFVKTSAPPPKSTYKQQGDVLELVHTTCDLLRPVGDQPNSDAWLIWAIAQRASLPLKVEACVDKGISYYRQALSGAVPLVGGNLLRACLTKVHRDIVTCWNFKDGAQILNGDEFKQLMLYIVQDVYETSESTTPPDINKISQFATLVTAASAQAAASVPMAHAVAPTPIAPAAAILGLSFFFLKWLLDTVLEKKAQVESIIMAYTVDLICVLKEVFYFTLMTPLAGETNWEGLQEAFQAYYLTNLVKRNHGSCRSASNRSLDQKGFRDEIEELVRDIKK